MKSLKVLSLVALLAPGISFAEGEAAKPEAAAKVENTAPAAAPTATVDHATEHAKPAAAKKPAKKSVQKAQKKQEAQPAATTTK